HDFNNILCAILGYTELALLDPHIKGLTRDNLQMVLNSSTRARDLIKRILTFSRTTDSQPHPLKLSAVIKEVVKMLQATLPSSISIHTAINTEEDVVVADSTEMHQVIMNLGTNAGHAMKAKGGRLDFELEAVNFANGSANGLRIPDGDYVHLVVRDNGRGMSPEVMERIFEPFFTTKAPGRGTGLGLALVQKIVTRSGGYIKVNSEVGRGTTFHLYLPKSNELPAPALADKNQILRGHHEQILVIDDEIPVLDMMQQHLRKMGYRVTTRADSREAMKTFRADAKHFDLVITDHTMPDLQGADLAEEIGALRPEVPVILITGLNNPPNLSGSRYAARRQVFQKPIDFIELSHCLRQLLEPVKKD
ncbi:MAG TPA: ATP-binding protein, partial [Candidatus Baltobacteraceae bacterium]|nr:ATP-binding protein [Candidatus Baltobacteraceae bacterium]